MREPTQEEAAAFTAHMSNTFGVKGLNKDDAQEMKMAADFLGTLGIIDHDTFLESYATTIGDTVWIPKKWEPWSKISTLPHEVWHSLQFRKEGNVTFAWTYLTDQEQRSLYEAEAYHVSSEMHFWRYGEPLDPAWVVESLKNYSIDEAHREVIRTYMLSANVTVAQGGVSHDTSRVAIAWLETNCPDIR